GAGGEHGRAERNGEEPETEARTDDPSQHDGASPPCPTVDERNAYRPCVTRPSPRRHRSTQWQDLSGGGNGTDADVGRITEQAVHQLEHLRRPLHPPAAAETAAGEA